MWKLSGNEKMYTLWYVCVCVCPSLPCGLFVISRPRVDKRIARRRATKNVLLYELLVGGIILRTRSEVAQCCARLPYKHRNLRTLHLAMSTQDVDGRRNVQCFVLQTDLDAKLWLPHAGQCQSPGLNCTVSQCGLLQLARFLKLWFPQVVQNQSPGNNCCNNGLGNLQSQLAQNMKDLWFIDSHRGHCQALSMSHCGGEGDLDRELDGLRLLARTPEPLERRHKGERDRELDGILAGTSEPLSERPLKGEHDDPELDGLRTRTPEPLSERPRKEDGDRDLGLVAGTPEPKERGARVGFCFACGGAGTPEPEERGPLAGIDFAFVGIGFACGGAGTPEPDEREPLVGIGFALGGAGTPEPEEREPLVGIDFACGGAGTPEPEEREPLGGIGFACGGGIGGGRGSRSRCTRRDKSCSNSSWQNPSR